MSLSMGSPSAALRFSAALRNPVHASAINFPRVADVRPYLLRCLSKSRRVRSWGDSTPGPLGLNVPEGLVSAKDIQQFNDQHIGIAYAVLAPSKSHFMNSACWTKLLRRRGRFKKQRIVFQPLSFRGGGNIFQGSTM